MAVSLKVLRVATYNVACLHSTTQTNLFWAVLEMVTWELEKQLVEIFSYYYEMTQTCLSKQIIYV